MPGFWRKCRIAFRCVRITAWTCALAVLALFLWFNRIGLPDFLKSRLVATLHEHGLDLEFSRMRLNLVHGIVADNVSLGEVGTNRTAAFGARLVQLELDWRTLLRHRRLELKGLVVHDGEFSLPLSPTNTLAIDNLQTELRFGANNTWSLNHFQAGFAGAQITVNGEIAHASEVGAWKMFSGHPTDRGSVINSLDAFAESLKQIHFTGRPELRIGVNGDARNVHSILVHVRAETDGVQTPWFAARGFQADATLSAPANAPTNLIAAWDFWTNLQPFRLVWSVKMDELRSASLPGKAIDCGGVWSAPTLTVKHFSVRLGGGRLAGEAGLNVATRDLAFSNDSDFDLHLLSRLLPETAQRELSEISWSRPPVLHTAGAVTLPPWTNGITTNWFQEIAATVRADGEVALTNFTFRHIGLDHLHTHFRYADELWALPDLSVAQGRTQLRLSGEESGATQNFHVLVAGRIDASSAQPFLTTSNAVEAFNEFAFDQPLHLSLDVSGNLRRWSSLTATGRVALTDFAVRGQTVDSLAADLFYTNRMLTFYAPELLRANHTQRMTADEVFLDFNAQTVWFTNGWSTAEPLVVARAVGPKTGHALEPFHFLTLPLVHVTGSAPMRDIHSASEAQDADLTFEIVHGVPFRWGSLQATNLTGTIHWLKETLYLTNLVAKLYDGTGHGSVALDFRPREHDFDYDFHAAVTNVNLHLLAHDISTVTNLEGLLAGEVTVTNASSDNWRTVNGFGHAQLRDGLLWDVPMFAFMSPVLNTVSPGLGNSRAKEAAAQFSISNGVIKTDSLLISSTMMRLQYAGSVDLQQNVNAKVTAQLLRNTPVLGSLFSTVLWPVSKIFECHVTGQLDEPVVKPIYIPKILLMPLHPIRSLEELFSPGNSSGANATSND